MLMPLLKCTNSVKFWGSGSQTFVCYHPAPYFAHSRIKIRNTPPCNVNWQFALGNEPAFGTTISPKGYKNQTTCFGMLNNMISFGFFAYYSTGIFLKMLWADNIF